MPTTTCSEGRRLAGALAAWIDAVDGGDVAGAGRCREESARLARGLAGNPVLGPVLRRHLPGGSPEGGAGAVACILAVIEADEAARAAAPNN